MGFDKGVAVLEVAHLHHFKVHTLIAPHGTRTLKLHHPFARMGKTDRPGDVVVHRVVDCLGQPGIQLQRIALHVHHRPGRAEGGAVARRVPGTARRQFVLFQQNAIGPAFLCEVIKCRDAHDTPADDDDPCGCRKFCHVNSPSAALSPRSGSSRPCRRCGCDRAGAVRSARLSNRWKSR